MSRRSLAARSALAILVSGLGVYLFFAGKGHILYLDTNMVVARGNELSAPDLCLVSVDGKEIGEMGRAERAIAEVAGPSHEIRVEPLDGGEAVVRKVKLPVRKAELVISIPAILAGEPDELVLADFTPPPAYEETGENSFSQDESEVIPLGD